jgi:hypothetical protein
MFTRGLNAVGEGAALIDITFEPVSSNRSLCCGFVPNVGESLYSNIIVTLAVEPQAAVGKDHDELPVATGLPRTWDEIALAFRWRGPGMQSGALGQSVRS